MLKESIDELVKIEDEKEYKEKLKEKEFIEALKYAVDFLTLSVSARFYDFMSKEVSINAIINSLL
jgi:uncharacterized UPF0160 family protein